MAAVVVVVVVLVVVVVVPFGPDSVTVVVVTVDILVNGGEGEEMRSLSSIDIVSAKP